MSYASEVLADSPLAYWRLGDGSTTTAADSSGNSRPATWGGGGPTYVSGLLTGDSNQAAKPNGNTAQVSNASWMNVSALTVEAWVKYDTVVANAGIIDRYGGGGVGVSTFLMYTPSSKLTFLIRDNVGDKLAQAPGTASTGTIYHVVGTCDGSNVKLYVNGSLVATTACGPLASGTANINLGIMNFFSAHTDGTLDEIAIYGTALSSTRVSAHYTAGTTSPDATVIAPAATATAAGLAPVVSGNFTASPPAATATAAALPPAVTGTGDATVSPPAASATASALPPTLAWDADLSAAAASATAAALAPSVAAGVTIAAPAATATAGAVAPFVDDGSGNQTVIVPAATATATALAPTVVQIFETSTDTSNMRHGRRRLAFATVTVTRPVVAPPDTLTLATRVDKAVAYPVPDMVDGRPT